MPLEMSEVHFGNTVVPYRILRSTRRRTVSIAIDPTDGVVVTAPAAATIAKLDDIVHRKAGWVLERLRRRSSSPPPPLAREYVSGETFLYLGRHYRLKVQPRAVEGASVRLLRGWLTVTLPAGLEANERASRVKTGLVGWYRQHAGKRLPERVAEWSGRVGVDEPKVLVREQRKRWASCDKSGVLRFNWRIIQAPMPLVDYVVAHELVHLVHPDHTPEFWGRLGRAMPDYEGRRERLRDAGKGYEW